LLRRPHAQNAVEVVAIILVVIYDKRLVRRFVLDLDTVRYDFSVYDTRIGPGIHQEVKFLDIPNGSLNDHPVVPEQPHWELDGDGTSDFRGRGIRGSHYLLRPAEFHG
jgi:hypothetical protein